MMDMFVAHVRQCLPVCAWTWVSKSKWEQIWWYSTMYTVYSPDRVNLSDGHILDGICCWRCNGQTTGRYCALNIIPSIKCLATPDIDSGSKAFRRNIDNYRERTSYRRYNMHRPPTPHHPHPHPHHNNDPCNIEHFYPNKGHCGSVSICTSNRLQSIVVLLFFPICCCCCCCSIDAMTMLATDIFFATVEYDRLFMERGYSKSKWSDLMCIEWPRVDNCEWMTIPSNGLMDVLLCVQMCKHLCLDHFHYNLIILFQLIWGLFTWMFCIQSIIIISKHQSSYHHRFIDNLFGSRLMLRFICIFPLFSANLIWGCVI